MDTRSLALGTFSLKERWFGVKVWWSRATLAVLCMTAVASLSAGCGGKGGSGKMSEADLQRAKAGAPKTMPPEAKAAMEKMHKEGGGGPPAGAKGPGR
jgi:hypothetical protein